MIMQGKYRCSQCPEAFDSIKNYIAHLEMHKDLMPEVPKPRKGIARLFGKFKKANTEVSKMAEKKEEVPTPTQAPPVPTPTPEPAQPDLVERMDGMERAMNQFAGMLTQTVDKLEAMQKPKVPQETVGSPEVAVEEEQIGEVPAHPGKKKLKVSVLVAEAQSGEFLKFLQGNEGYELDDISVTK